MTTYATTGQAALIRKMMQSHVVTDAERARLETRLTHGFITTPGDVIEWLQAQIKERKEAERNAAKAAQHEASL